MVKFLKILLVITSFLGIIFLIFLQKKNTVPDQMSCNYFYQHCWIQGFIAECVWWDRVFILTWQDREEYLKCLMSEK